MLGGSELAARRTSRSSAARMNSCCAATQPNTASSRPEMTRHQSSTNMNSVLCAAGGRGACKATESAHRATSRITNCACACRTLLTDRIQYLYAAHAVACTISRTQTFAPRTTHGARERERESECEAAARHTASKREARASAPGPACRAAATAGRRSRTSTTASRHAWLVASALAPSRACRAARARPRRASRAVPPRPAAARTSRTVGLHTPPA